MIPSRFVGKSIVQTYPFSPHEKDSVRRILIIYRRFRRLMTKYSSRPAQFISLNFFEYVLKCRMEYNLQLSLN